MPSIQNFKEWTKERCKDAQRTYRDKQLNPIVDMFVSAFAKSNKAIKDGYDSQMFESATPELLRKITGVIAEHGCKDVKEWMQKSLWYREFELGREAERKLKREREWEW